MSFITRPLSDLVDGGGLIVQASNPKERVEYIDRSTIIQLFELHGVILFRGFDLKPDQTVVVTDSFTQKYAQDALGRTRRFGTTEIGSISDWGPEEIGLHSEAAFAPTWPEIIWFYCRVPSTAKAFTTLCDGIMLWKELLLSTQRFFLRQPVIYHYTIDLGNKIPGGDRDPWPFQTVGVDGFLDREKGLAELKITRFAITESRFGSLCFSNHVFNDFPGLTTTTLDGRPLPNEILQEINEKSRRLIHDVRWETNDFLMLDNRRFMHGRREFDSKADPRDIVQIQSAICSFAYGVTAKQQIPRVRSKLRD